MSDRRKSPLDLQPIEMHQCSVDLRLSLLSQVPFFAGLTAQAIVEINRSFHERGFLQGETIYSAGDPAGRLYVVADGRVRLLSHTFTGRDVLLDLLQPGEFFGSLTSGPSVEQFDTAVAHTPVCVLSIDAEAFRQVLDRYPPVALKVLDITAARLRSAQERVRQLSAYPVEKRIASTLLHLAAKFGRKGELGLLIQTPLSRDDLAEMTGTTTESASRVMSAFQKEGWIQAGRQWVAITDRDPLQALLDE